MQEFNGVYMEYEGRCSLRIAKGTNMLLMVEWYDENKSKEDVKNV